ncbi:hypothetical protein ACFVZW_20895 [Streptomyces sp. NPDC059567]|uniref:hypothetical protein n=1 Tax=Streptomyces sp. NPDC059567 TaxID=3346867 RepID=UPI0036A298BA
MRRAIRIGALVAGGLALAGCGIRQSDVVEVGGPATVAVAPGEGGRMLLFYVDTDGRLMPVAREIGGPIDGWEEYRMPFGKPPPTYPLGSGIVGSRALAALLEGPNKEEKAAGLATRLPGPGGWTDKEIPQILPEPDTTDVNGERTLRIRLPFSVGELDGAAIRQLVCTVAYNEETDGLASVVLTGPGGALPAERCDDVRVGSAVRDASDGPDDTESATHGTGRTGTGGTGPSGATTPSTTAPPPRHTPTP